LSSINWPISNSLIISYKYPSLIIKTQNQLKTCHRSLPLRPPWISASPSKSQKPTNSMQEQSYCCLKDFNTWCTTQENVASKPKEISPKTTQKMRSRSTGSTLTGNSPFPLITQTPFPQKLRKISFRFPTLSQDFFNKFSGTN
jgi:hypothetical protein